LKILLLLAGLAVALAGLCFGSASFRSWQSASSGPEAKQAGKSSPVSVTDDRGMTIALDMPAQRIVSLAPHVTENLFAIGAGKQVVGAVNFSDYPAEAEQIPRVGGYNNIDLERIRALKPDLIVAWQSGNPQKQLALLETLGIPVFYENSRTLKQVPTVLERLGTLTGKTDEARSAALHFSERIEKLEKQYAGRAPVRVFYQVWDRPLMTINGEQIISDAMRACGAVNVFASQPSLTPTIDEEAVLAADPDLITTSLHGSKDESLERWRRWPNLAAVRNQRLIALPKDLLNRMGPRLADGTEALCDAVEKTRKP